MKKLCALVLALCLMGGWAAADELRGYEKENGYVYISLGEYPQTADGGVLPILWRVLTVDEEKAYLLSEYILFARTMHTSLKEYRDVLKGDFGQTELCKYLNSDFAEDAFTAEEMEMLIPCENFGKIFLISREDMKNKEYGLGSTNPGTTSAKKIEADPGVRAWGTEWAKYGGCSPWWARSQSTTDARHAICTKDGGQIGHIEVGRDNEGVRPAVYLALNAFEIASGSGSREDPWVIRPAGAE